MENEICKQAERDYFTATIYYRYRLNLAHDDFRRSENLILQKIKSFNKDRTRVFDMQSEVDGEIVCFGESYESVFNQMKAVVTFLRTNKEIDLINGEIFCAYVWNMVDGEEKS